MLKMKNCSILDIIYKIIQHKSIQIELVKVKAHKGDRWNEYVDKLAKRQHCSTKFGSGQSVQTQDGNQTSFGKELRLKALLGNFYGSSNVDTQKENGSLRLKMILKKSNQSTRTFYGPDVGRGSKKCVESGAKQVNKVAC